MQTRIHDHHSYACFPHLQDSCFGDKQLVTNSNIQRLPLTSLPGELEADFPEHVSFFAHVCIILRPSCFLEVVNPFSSLSLTLVFIFTQIIIFSVLQITLNTQALVLLRVNRHFLQAFPHDYNLLSQISYCTGTPEFGAHQEST